MSGSSTPTIIIAICILGGLLFLFPLITLTERVDNVTQENVRLICEEFTTDVANTGKLTRSKYQNFEDKLAATGNTYEIELELYELDENPGKKTAQTNYSKIGENVYVTSYTTQILPQIGIKTGSETVDSGNDTLYLDQGDIFAVKVKNANSTSNQVIKSNFLNFSNAGEEAIKASSSKMCTVNGSN